MLKVALFVSCKTSDFLDTACHQNDSTDANFAQICRKQTCDIYKIMDISRTFFTNIVFNERCDFIAYNYHKIMFYKYL
jgi:hypothetical protein